MIIARKQRSNPKMVLLQHNTEQKSSAFPGNRAMGDLSQLSSTQHKKMFHFVCVNVPAA